jgi:CheY-like chemotaxis protein
MPPDLSGAIAADSRATIAIRSGSHSDRAASQRCTCGTRLAFTIVSQSPREAAMQIGVKVAKVIARRRVFVVDDNEAFRAAIEFMLHDEYEAHELTSATEALAKEEQMRPDLLVLAEGVIRVNGLDLIQEFLARVPETKIIVIVDQISSGFGQECVAAGAHGFLAKPLRSELLRDKVDALLSARKKAVTMPRAVLNMR